MVDQWRRYRLPVVTGVVEPHEAGGMARAWIVDLKVDTVMQLPQWRCSRFGEQWWLQAVILIKCCILLIILSMHCWLTSGIALAWRHDLAGIPHKNHQMFEAMNYQNIYHFRFFLYEIYKFDCGMPINRPSAFNRCR